MSAITIVFNRHRKPVDMHVVDRMLAASAGRAIDGQASWRGNGLAMAKQHFWLTPEEVGERQPLVDSEAGLSIVADARLDNRETLLASLGISPGDGKTMSDTALLLRAYRRWGTACAHYLLGDFAFAIWDAVEESLFLARDPLGARGLCTYIDDELFLAASEIKQIVAHPAVTAEVNEAKVAQFLAVKWDDQEQTFYRSINYCPPAHCLLVKSDRLRQWRYWDIDPTRRLRYRDEREYAEQFLSLLDEAVQCRMRSAYPIGISLSGGLDSSSVAALAARRLPQDGHAQRDLFSFSYVFDELKSCDERRFIEPVVAANNMRVSYIRGDDKWPLRHLSDWPDDPDFVHHDPFALLPLAVMKEASRADCRVLLTGHFGDWLFLGSAFWAADTLRDRRLGTLIDVLRVDGASVNKRRALFDNGLRQLRPSWIRRFYRRMRPPGGAWSNPGLHPDLVSLLGPARRSDPLGQRLFPSPDLGRRYRFLTDGAVAQSMATMQGTYNRHGVQRVDPLFDRRLVEFMMALPADQLGRPGESRLVMRRAMRDVLPESVRQRTTKAEFMPLFEKGILHKERQMVATLMQDAQIVRRRYAKEAWLKETLSSDWSDAGYFMWLFISLELWLRRYWPANGAMNAVVSESWPLAIVEAII